MHRAGREADGLHLPSSRKMILSSPSTVEMRCAMSRVVLPGTALLEVIEDDFFRLGIHRRNRVVEDQDGRIFQQARAMEMRCF